MTEGVILKDGAPTGNRFTYGSLEELMAHPNKEIEAAIQYAESRGWRFVASAGHIYGKLYCPGGERGACIQSVYSTPRVPERHARRIRRAVDNCPH
jgi:hypothetical protein